MEVNNEESRISVTFGHEWVGEAPTHVKANVVVSKPEVLAQIEKLNQLAPGEVSANNGLVIVLSCASYNQDNLADAFREAYSMLLPLSPIPLGEDSLGLKIVKAPGKLVINLSPAGPYQEKVAEIREMLEGLGILALAEEQSNKIEVSAEVNRTFGDLANAIHNGESFLSALLYQSKYFIKLFLDKNFGETLKNQLSNLVDPEIGNLPPILALQYLRRINMDLKFNSTAELPNLFKKYLCNPSKVRNMEPEKKKLQNIPPLLEKFLENLESPVEVHVNVAEFASVSLSLSGPNFASFLREFGGAMKSYTPAH